MRDGNTPMGRRSGLLESVDRWFEEVRVRHSEGMQCGRGCSLCCHGLFDVTLPDAVRLAEGMSLLPQPVLRQVTARAEVLHEEIGKQAPRLEAPWLLTELTEEEIDAVVESMPGPPCPFLGEEGECLVYDHRPIACRLEGVPMVDASDGLFGDWCELNFVDGVPREALRDFERDYYAMEEIEAAATEALSEALFGERHSRVTLFIPSLAVAYESFWKPLLQRIEVEGSSSEEEMRDA